MHHIHLVLRDREARESLLVRGERGQARNRRVRGLDRGGCGTADLLNRSPRTMYAPLESSPSRSKGQRAPIAVQPHVRPGV